MGSGDVEVKHCGDHSGQCVKTCALEEEVKSLRVWRIGIEKEIADREIEDAKGALKKEADLQIIKAAAKNNLISQILSGLAIVAAIVTAILVR